ncbi:MAG: hypothetical protein IJ261_00350 [Clostridia bacterium]|nr:hypothetical protein [Clostridia bacterium]
MKKIAIITKLLDALRFFQKKTVFLVPLWVLVIAFSGVFELASEADRPSEVSKTMFVNVDSWDRSQDMTTDGNHFYFSSKYGLTQTKLDCETVTMRKSNAIPEKFVEEYGSAHIGGISYYKDKLYCAVEDSKVWQHPLILVYNAYTLEFTGEFYHLDPEKHTKGLPWICVDSDTGLIYTSSRDNSTEIMCYDTKTQQYLESIVLVNPDADFNIHKIQGGEISDGVLYLATNNETQAVYAVELATGRAQKLFDRNLFSGSEGEGITVLATQDGAYLHCMDMSPIFLSCYVRHFAQPQF